MFSDWPQEQHLRKEDLCHQKRQLTGKQRQGDHANAPQVDAGRDSFFTKPQLWRPRMLS
jgi:hypothetical protein